MDFVSRAIYTVSRLTAEIRDILETSFDEIWVEGEVSNLRVPPSGHVYFTLKDESSQIQAVIFRSQARLVNFELEDGLSIVCRGRIGVYEQRGQYQIIVDLMEPRGLGALQLAFDQLKRRLEAEGLFDSSRKKPLPHLPKRVGIVTSPAGAVIRDMLTILKRRYENVGVLVYPARVQGEGASEEIAAGITFLDRHTDVDVIVLARGGGSLEDLWAFNEEMVARAIEKAKKPIVSAVGHEVDFTISDFAADVRAPTPSAAAEIVVRNKVDLLVQVERFQSRLINGVYTILKGRRELWAKVNAHLKDPKGRLVDLRLKGDDLMVRLQGGLRRILDDKWSGIANMEKNFFYRAPTSKIGRFRDSLGQWTEKLGSTMSNHLRLKRGSLERSMDRLDGMSPLNILRRGYSIVHRIPSMEIVRDSRIVEKGDKVDVRLHLGRLICKVEKTKPNS